MALLDKVNMLITPNAFKTGKGYVVIGASDLAVLRNTTATRVNSAGIIELVGSNIMRIDYTTGTPVILDEAQSTNLAPFSNDYSNSTWIKSNLTLTTNSSISPDGTQNSNKLAPDAVSGAHNVANTFNATAGVINSYSVFIKHAGWQWVVFGQVSSNNISGFFFDTINGVIGSVSNNVLDSKITSLSNGYYRLDVKVLGINFAKHSLAFSNLDDGNFNLFGGAKNPITGNSINGVQVFNAQICQNNFFTSSIFTSGAAVTRNDDLITIAPPAGTVRITTTFLDNTTQIINTIPALFTLPQGQITQVMFQNSL